MAAARGLMLSLAGVSVALIRAARMHVLSRDLCRTCSSLPRLRSGEGRPADLWLPVAGGTSPGADRLAPLAPALREQARRRRSPILDAGTGDLHAGAHDDLVPLGPHALHGAPARALFLSICSVAVSTITATSSSATNPHSTARSSVGPAWASRRPANNRARSCRSAPGAVAVCMMPSPLGSVVASGGNALPDIHPPLCSRPGSTSRRRTARGRVAVARCRSSCYGR